MAKLATALLLSSALLFAATDARAAESAEEKFEKAQDACADLMRGQRSFCMIQAHQQYRIDKAAQNKSDITVHHDYDTSNDTPEQTSAKQAYEQEADRCADLPRGQRSFCMIQAHQQYRQGMGW